MATESSSQKNQVVGYLRPYISKLVEADRIVNDKSASKIVNEALEGHYGKMAVKDQEALINRAKNISKNSY